MAGNPLMAMMGGNNGGMPPAVQNLMSQNMPGFGPFGNMINMISQFKQFRDTCNMTNAQAKEKVMSMLNSGQINQQQLNQLKDVADMLGIK